MSMITPAVYDLTIVRGADYSFLFDIDIDGTILNLAGASVYASIRKDPSREGVAVDDFTVAVSVGTDTGYDSDVTLSFTDVETLAIDAGTYYYDVLVVGGSGDRTYYLSGKVNVLESVTTGA